MPKVTFLPLDLTVEVEQGTTLLDAALDNGIEIEHNCGGVCACTTCHVIVKKGEDNLSELEDNEDDRLNMADGLTITSRLGCQAKVENGDVTVEIPDSSRKIQS
jgi:ferredoxin, 2Fe-2S